MVMRVVIGLVVASTSGCVPTVGDLTIYGTAMLTQAAPSSAMPDFDNSVIVVCGLCGELACDCTGVDGPAVAADGTYRVDQRGTGLHHYSASAPSTLEGSVSFTVDGQGDVEAPTVALTALGDVTGTVTGLPVPSGVVVTVDGSSLTATTDALGAFTLAGVETGSQTLTAFQPGSPAVAIHATASVPYASPVTVVLDFSGN